MAGGNLGLLQLLLLVLTSLVHLALAHRSPQDAQQHHNKHKHVQAPRKYSVGYYHGELPFYDNVEGDSYNGQNDGSEQSYPYYKPKPNYYKPKPIYRRKSRQPKPTPMAPLPYPYPDIPPQEELASPPPAYNPPPLEEPPQEAPPTYSKPPTRLAPPPAASSTPPPLPPAVTSTPPPYKVPAPSYNPSPSSSWAQQWLGPHNAARAELSLPPMVWSDSVAQFAESWANQRKLNGCGLQHSNGPYGENIFWGSGGSYGPAECVAAWVSEKNYYNYGDNSCAPGQQCGHYTQIVWATSLNLGCAKVQCDSGQIFMTCNYDPPGNWVGNKPY